jgi:hypothetical protein
MRRDLRRRGSGFHLLFGVAEDPLGERVGEAETAADIGIVSYGESYRRHGLKPSSCEPSAGWLTVSQFDCRNHSPGQVRLASISTPPRTSCAIKRGHSQPGSQTGSRARHGGLGLAFELFG